MPQFGPPITIPDQQDAYPAWCRLWAHRWHRKPYEYPIRWTRTRDCKRCRNIPAPDHRGERRP